MESTTFWPGLIREEMRISERRRILFCEQPVASLLGLNNQCPFGKDDIKPLKFRNFRKSIRIHILLIHEWLRSWRIYEQLDVQDLITFFRKCALFHTVLDPVFISLQFGDPSKFILHNGGYVSLDPEKEKEGWEDEKEISQENKKKIYWPLLKRIKSDILDPMANLKLSFEECVALKALISIQTTIPDVSERGKEILKRQLDNLSSSLFNNYLLCTEEDRAERFGSILMLLSPIFETADQFVESHHQGNDIFRHMAAGQLNVAVLTETSIINLDRVLFLQ
ncbi:NR LBD domain-containing protein [Aphelenchoides bicaudatus]|nr:NR LBD domain-containing protein [Aphelenchoides bicaudatus]